MSRVSAWGPLPRFSWLFLNAREQTLYRFTFLTNTGCFLVSIIWLFLLFIHFFDSLWKRASFSWSLIFLSLHLCSCLSPTNDQIKERERDRMTQTLYLACPSLTKSKTLKASCFFLCVCNLGFLVGSPPLSCWCMTHVTLIKPCRYYSNASCSDVISGCHSFGSADMMLWGKTADSFGNASNVQPWK